MKRINREVRKLLSIFLVAVMLVSAVPQTAFSAEAKTEENTGTDTGIVSEMPGEYLETKDTLDPEETSEGEPEETGIEDLESEEKPEETGTEDLESEEKTEETGIEDLESEEKPEEIGIAKLSEEISEEDASDNTFEVDYIIYEVISEQDHTVRVKGMNRYDFNRFHMEQDWWATDVGPVELTIPAAVTSEQVTWQVTEIGEFALADYTYNESNKPGNALNADKLIGGGTYDDTYEYLYHTSLYISKVTVSSGITRIGKGAFYRTYWIDEIVLPETVVEIGEGAFYFDEEERYYREPWNPLKVNIPTGIKTISAYAYHGVFFDGMLKIPNGVEVIEECAFACDSEASGTYAVEIPASVKKIKKNAFDIVTLLRAALYQTDTPFPAVLDGSAEIEYSSWMLGAGGDKELTLFVPESLMDIYRLRQVSYWPNLVVKNLSEYKGTQESPLRFLYNGREITVLKIPLSIPTLPEERRTITIDMGEADFRLDDIMWSFALDGSEVTEEELKEYLRYEVNADGTMSFVGVWFAAAITVTAEVDGYLPASFTIHVTDKLSNEEFLDKVKSLTAEDIAEMKKISYSPETAFQLDEIRTMAEEITEGCISDRDKMLAVHTWLADHIVYDFDTLNYIEDPVLAPYAACPCEAYEVLKNRYTICEGYANLAEAMLRSIDIPCATVTGMATGAVYGEKRFGHAWNMAYDGNEGRWIYFDATFDNVGAVGDNFIGSSERWEGETPDCFDFDAEQRMKDGMEFQYANFEEISGSFRDVVKCSYITLFPGEKGKFQALQGFDNVTIRLDDEFTDTDLIELDAEGNIKALKPGTVRLHIEGLNLDRHTLVDMDVHVRVLEKESFAFERAEVKIGTENEYKYKVSCWLNGEYVNCFAEMTSDHPDVVTVREDGTLEPKKTGTAVITARLFITAAEEKPEASCRVTVVEGRTIVDDGRLIYYLLSEPSGSDSGTVEIIDNMLGKLNEDRSNMITTLEIPDLVTLEGKTYAVIGIGRAAFSKRRNPNYVITWITEVVLPDTLQYIKREAFYGTGFFMESLTVNFPASLQRIEEGAFFNFNLSDVVFPEGSQLSYIGDSVFAFSKLKKLDLSNCSQLREIRGGEFVNCVGYLEEVKLPDGLKTIGAEAFSENRKLTSIRMPSTVESIGDRAFYHTALRTIDLSGATTLGKWLFYECEAIETVILSDDLREIPEHTFVRNDALKNVLSKSYLEELGGIEHVEGGIFKLPESVKTIGDGAFQYTGLTGTIDLSGVSELGTDVFGFSRGIETIILSDEINEIPEECFSYIDNLRSVVSKSRLEEWKSVNQEEGAVLLSDQITKIGKDAFFDCINLRSVEAPGVKELGEDAFAGCEKLKEVTLSDELTVIPKGAFYLCSSLEGYPFGDKIERIGEEAFAGCEQFGNSTDGVILLSDQITKIGTSVFDNCLNIRSVEAPGVKELGERAFYGCEKLEKVALSDELTVIPEGAFAWCSSLDGFPFGDTIERIEREAFIGCELLGSSTDGAIELGRGIRSIEDLAFYNCTSIKTVTIYSKVMESIGGASFSTKPVLYIYKLPSRTTERTLKNCVSEIIYMPDDMVLAETITIDPAEAVLAVGDTKQLVCTVLPKNTDKPEVEWSSSDPDIAQVQEGLVLAKKAGVVSITATTTDGSNLTAVCTVTVKEASGEEPDDKDPKPGTGDGNDPKPGTGDGNDPNPGTGDDDHVGLEVKLANPEEEYIYTGSAIRPAIIVTNNGKVLTEGVDYTVKYSNNIKACEWGKGGNAPKNAPRITVSGKGNLTGSTFTNFRIAKKSIGEADTVGGTASVKAGAVVVVKNSKAAPVLVYNGVKLGTKDYKFKDPDDAKKKFAEEGTITLEGQNNFTGERTIQVKVVENKQDLKKFKVTVNKVDYTYGDGRTHDADVTIQDAATGKDLTPDEDFTIVYNNVDRDNAGTVKFMIVGLGEYSGTVAKSFVVKPRKAAMTAELKDKNKAYLYSSAGVTIGSDLVVKDTALNNAVLKPGKDYKVTYSNNKKVSTDKSQAKYTVSFLGNYKGSRAVSGTFSIKAAPLGNDAAGLKIAAADKTYKKPGLYKSEPYVTIDGVALKSSDYKAEYYLDEAMTRPMSGNDKVTVAEGDSSATVYVKITGKGNYAPADANTYASTTYKVCKVGQGQQDLSKARVTVLDKNGNKQTKAEYTGLEVEPAVKVEVKVGKDWKVVDSADYNVTYVNNVNKGKATVMITAKGDSAEYVSSRTATFTIVARSLKNQTGLLDNLFKMLGK